MPPKRKPSQKIARAAKVSKKNDEDIGGRHKENVQKGKKAAANWNIVSWNVNGIRAWIKKPDGLKFIGDNKPDLFVFQETKCGAKDMPKEIKDIPGYFTFFDEVRAAKNGYAGVLLASKTKPLDVTFGMGVGAHDNEGRVVTAEYDKFFCVGVYVPNSGRGLNRLEYRQQWDKDFLRYLKSLEKTKPVICAGDLNVAHNEIDLKNPDKNRNKTAGFTDEERADFDRLLDAGFVDSFRNLHPNAKDAYTFWSYMFNAREKNIGWRLDYFVVSEKLIGKVDKSTIHSKIMGSDHCPISLKITV